jgi:hypothetical protein
MLDGFLKFAGASRPAIVIANEYRAHLIDVGQSAALAKVFFGNYLRLA